jgi:glucose/arabinose dehydrogenase
LLKRFRRTAWPVALGMLIGCSPAQPGAGGETGRGDSAVDVGAVGSIPDCDPDNGGLSLPSGFCALVAHEGVGPARHLAVAANGNVYVALRNRQGEEGGVLALRDASGDGRLDESVRFGPEGGTGIGIDGGYLYFAPNTYVVRWKLPEDGSLRPEGAAERVVEGFPEQRSHGAKSVAFDGRGNLWVNVGAPSAANCGINDGQEGARGQDPCPELQWQAGVWRFDTRTGQHQRDGERWATGIRNAVALAYNPTAHALYGVQHGRDQLNVVAPEHFTAQMNAQLPSEEFQRLDRGANFGWPYCHHDPLQGRRVVAPEYGGDGRQVGNCARFPDPVTAYPAHWAPNDLLFYTGQQFPARYRGGAFIAWHGSWNRSPEPQRGYKVTFQAMSAGRPADAWEVFADGFAGHEVIASPADAAFRPMGLAQGPDGSVYIVDSKEGRIWRVVYRAD